MDDSYSRRITHVYLVGLRLRKVALVAAWDIRIVLGNVASSAR